MKKLSLIICLVSLAIPFVGKGITEEEAKLKINRFFVFFAKKQLEYKKPIDNAFNEENEQAQAVMEDALKRKKECNCFNSPSSPECQIQNLRFEEARLSSKQAAEVRRMAIDNIQARMYRDFPQESEEYQKLENLLNIQLAAAVQEKANQEKVNVQADKIVKAFMAQQNNQQ